MIHLLHGDNTEASRTHLFRLKTEGKGKEIRELDGRTLDRTALTQALESASLFGDERVVIIDNLFTRLGKKGLIDEMINLLVKSSKTTNIILWEEKEVGKPILGKLGSSVKAQLFKIPAVIFDLLDALKPGNNKALLTLYRRVIAIQSAEIVFVLITRRLRQLIMFADRATPPGLADWQVARLTRQARLFTMEKLLRMYQQLLTIEYAIKSGSSPFTLTQHLEQFVMGL